MRAGTLNIMTSLAFVLALAGCGGGSDASTSTAASTLATPAPAEGAPPAPAPAPASCTELTYSANASATGNPFTQGQKVCFDASSTSLGYNGKTLTNPVKNDLVTAPFSAYKFVDGTYALEVVFNAGALYEINVSDDKVFYGQFAK